ncbi:MAG TPA: hypothetical protein VLM38_18710 [Blastocatellia bacterium]|nr:hypothetical protein [Blastocatellia bacterium]
MKARMLCVLAVFALMTVAVAQKRHDVAALVMLPATVTVGEEFQIELYVVNNGTRDVTIREIELYCGPSGDSAWGEIWTQSRVTIEGGGGMATFDCKYKATSTGPWSIQCRMRFSGNEKANMITPTKEFIVMPRP